MNKRGISKSAQIIVYLKEWIPINEKPLQINAVKFVTQN